MIRPSSLKSGHWIEVAALLLRSELLKMRHFRIISRSIHFTIRNNPPNSNFFTQKREKSSFLGLIRSKNGLAFSCRNPNGLPRLSTAIREFTASAEESKAPPPPPPPPSERVSAIVEEISGLTLLEVADLTELLRKKLDVQEMPIMGVMMPGMQFGMKGPGKGGGGADKAEEKAAEKKAFDLKLEGFDASAKLKVIKEVKAFTGLGMKEAKDLVEKAPAVLKNAVPREEAEKMIAKLKEVGAKVSME